MHSAPIRPLATRLGSSRPLLLLLSLFMPSCLGDQFGGANNGGTDEDCVEVERRSVSLSELTPAGYRAQDILQFAASDFDVPFRLSIPDEEYSYPYSGLVVVPEGDTTLHVTIESQSDSATYVEREVEPGSRLTPDCRDYVEMDATITLRADNGAFDDTLPVVLRGTQMTMAEIRVDLTPGEMRGSFDLLQEGKVELMNLVEQPDRWELDQTELLLWIHRDHIRGDLAAWYDGTYSDERRTSAFVELWRTPYEEAAACYTGDFGGPLDDGQAVSRLRSLLTKPRRFLVHFTGSEGIDTELQARIEPPEKFCLGEVVRPSLHFETEVVLTRADTGEPFGTWPLGGAAYYMAEGAFDDVSMNYYVELAEPFDADDIETTLGDFGVDLYGAALVSRSYWLESDSNGQWRGTLELEKDEKVVATATIEEVE